MSWTTPFGNIIVEEGYKDDEKRKPFALISLSLSLYSAWQEVVPMLMASFQSSPPTTTTLP